MWFVRTVRSHQRRRGRFGSNSTTPKSSSRRKNISADLHFSSDPSADGESEDETTTGIADLVRMMWASKTSSSKDEVVGEAKRTWKPRSALDVSGHSFDKALQEELRRARQSCNGLPSPDPHSAANRKRQLAGLRSPKSGSSSFKDDFASPGPAWWDDNTSAPHSRCSSTSTCPPSPPQARANLPPRAPTGRSGGQPGSRRCTTHRKEIAVTVT
ncbi:unnamed protein product [Ascophyllum nodosum]